MENKTKMFDAKILKFMHFFLQYAFPKNFLKAPSNA